VKKNTENKIYVEVRVIGIIAVAIIVELNHGTFGKVVQKLS